MVLNFLLMQSILHLHFFTSLLSLSHLHLPYFSSIKPKKKRQNRTHYQAGTKISNLLITLGKKVKYPSTPGSKKLKNNIKYGLLAATEVKTQEKK